MVQYSYGFVEKMIKKTAVRGFDPLHEITSENTHKVINHWHPPFKKKKITKSTCKAVN